jgi:hypothetical protein
MSAVPTFEVEPRPLEVPDALLALDSDTAVTALRNWFDFAIEETTNAGEIKSEIEQRIKDQAAGLFSIDEAACIIAGETGEWPKEARTQIWQAIDDGRITPVSYKTRAKLRLPLRGTNERLALVRTNELANLFEAWPFKPAPQTAAAPTQQHAKTVQHTTKSARRRTLQPEIEHAQSLCKNEWDSAAVWGALQKMAESKYGQLIGATEDGLQYLESGDAKIFTRDALGKRLKKRSPT